MLNYDGSQKMSKITFAQKLKGLFSKGKIDEDFFEELRGGL